MFRQEVQEEDKLEKAEKGPKEVSKEMASKKKKKDYRVYKSKDKPILSNN